MDSEAIEEKKETNFNLLSNYPNPFNPTTTINYELQNVSNANMIIFNATGEMVWETGNRRQEAGEYSVEFDGSGMNSGIYFYTLEINGKMMQKKKMVMIK